MAEPFLAPTSQRVAGYVGSQEVLTVEAPALGAEWSLALPGDAWWRLIGGTVTFTTSVAVGNRAPGLQYVFGGVRTVGVMPVAVVGPSITETMLYTGSVGSIAPRTDVGTQVVGWPDIVMLPGMVLGSLTPNLQADDQYGAVALLMERIYNAAEETAEPTPQTDVLLLDSPPTPGIVGVA